MGFRDWLEAATVATVATVDGGEGESVAGVAGVAGVGNLTKEEKAELLAFMEHIGETDRQIVAYVLQHCARDPEAKATFLRDARKR
jgi:hypothetical protein